MKVLLRERLGAVEILTLNRPERRNALSRVLMEELSNAFEQLAVDNTVRVVVLTGSGDKAFCSGMDLKDFASGVAAECEQRPIAHFEAFLRGRFVKPVIGAVNATALAGGFELVLGCDLSVAASSARFGLPEVQAGLFAVGACAVLPGRLPLALALELGLTAEPIDAERALQLGLVNRVVEAGDVLSTALALAERIAKNAPLAVEATKRLMWASAESGAESVRGEVASTFALISQSEDALEGSRAFAQKRVPVWKGC